MASLFEQYESQEASSYRPDGVLPRVPSVSTEGIINLRSDNEEPIFAKNKIDFKPSFNLTHMVVSNNQLLLAMENKTLLKIDLLNPSKPIEVDLNLHQTDKSRSGQISGIFVDPMGRHCLISMSNRLTGEVQPYENYYFQRKVTCLSKAKGHVITAVGWNVAPPSDGSTGSILIGTIEGRLFETALLADDRFLASKELFWRAICQLGQECSSSSGTSSPTLTSASPEPICAITTFALPSTGELCILVATRNFFYQFVGQHSPSDGLPHLYHIFSNPNSKSYKEMPGYLPFTYLDLSYSPMAGTCGTYPKAFAWLTKPGIFYGEIPADLSTSRVFENAYMIMYNDLKCSQPSEEAPISLVLTKFHLLLLYPTHLKIVCVLNQEVILEDQFVEPCRGLCKDPVRNTIWVFTQRTVYRYKVTAEDRHIWAIYLAKKDFDQARLYAGKDLIKMDKTICQEAMHYFSKGDYKRSAQLFASTRSKSFEEIALKFIELRDRDQEALKEYLLCKLTTLSPIRERTQIILLLLWLFEIHLNQLATLSNAMHDSALESSEVLKIKVDYNRLESSLKNLISDANYKACHKRNKSILYDLMRKHGNQAILVYFAEAIDDLETLIEHHLQTGEYLRALNILRVEESLELYYRYAPQVVQHVPEQLVTQLIPLAAQVDFAKLIPSLVHFDHTNDHQTGIDLKREKQCKEILRFLEYTVQTLQTKDSLAHNYLIALYAQYAPDRLLSYLQDWGHDEMSVPYDIRYAARICTQLGHVPQATVHILSTMGAHEEAVEQALAANEIDLAKQTAEKVSDRPDLAKRLWLKIAKFVIGKLGLSDRGGFNLQTATSILNECSLLKIEDLLPYFPEFLTIDHFKDAICQSLEEYNRNIENLRSDMKMATDSACEIREEIKELRNRYMVISADDRCALCQLGIFSQHFLAFHCSHLFHQKCLASEILEYLETTDRVHLEKLLHEEKSLMSLPSSGATSGESANSIAVANRLEEIATQVEDLIGSECLFCGNYLINTIDKPFFDPIKDKDELRGWL